MFSPDTDVTDARTLARHFGLRELRPSFYTSPLLQRRGACCSAAASADDGVRRA